MTAASQQTATKAFPSSTTQPSSASSTQSFLSSTTSQPLFTSQSLGQSSTGSASERSSLSLSQSNSSNSSNSTSSQNRPASDSLAFDVEIVIAVVAVTGMLTGVITLIWNKRKHNQESIKLIDRQNATPSPEEALQGQTPPSSEVRPADASTQHTQWNATLTRNTNTPNASMSPQFDAKPRLRASVSNTIRSNGSDVPENEPRDILLYSSSGIKFPAAAKLDTAAEDSFIGLNKFLLLGYPLEKSRTPVRFTAANNKTFVAEYTTTLKFEGTSISRNRFVQSFYVLEDLPVEVLLGNRFLEKNGIIRINRSVLPILRNRVQKEDPAETKKRREEAEKRAKEQEKMKDVIWVRGPDGKYRRDDEVHNGAGAQGQGGA